LGFEWTKNEKCSQIIHEKRGEGGLGEIKQPLGKQEKIKERGFYLLLEREKKDEFLVGGERKEGDVFSSGSGEGGS